MDVSPFECSIATAARLCLLCHMVFIGRWCENLVSSDFISPIVFELLRERLLLTFVFAREPAQTLPVSFSLLCPLTPPGGGR